MPLTDFSFKILVSLPEEIDDKSLVYYTPSYADENS